MLCPSLPVLVTRPPPLTADAQHDHGHEEERYTGHPKVSQWELCTAPWQTRGGFVNTTDGGEAVSETELGIVVRRLYPCPYNEEVSG